MQSKRILKQRKGENCYEAMEKSYGFMTAAALAAGLLWEQERKWCTAGLEESAVGF